MDENVYQTLKGHICIRDVDTNEILVDKDNAINYENFSLALARTVANRTDGWIQSMVFGNGAATVSGTGTITYLPPNVIGIAAQLYHQTYSTVVNDISPLNKTPNDNYITTAHVSGTTYSDVIITCNLSVGEPYGQSAFDAATDLSSNFIFNEIGIVAYDPNGQGKLLTHVIFSPLQKSLNRRIEIVYTIRIQTV